MSVLGEVAWRGSGKMKVKKLKEGKVKGDENDKKMKKDDLQSVKPLDRKEADLSIFGFLYVLKQYSVCEEFVGW